jgi:hypothetical protein
MAELKRKPRISGAEVTQIAREAMPDVPTTTAREANRAYFLPPPSVQVCFRCSPELADRLSDLARQKAGGMRELIVGLLQQAGIPVPAIDVERPDMRRRRRVG